MCAQEVVCMLLQTLSQHLAACLRKLRTKLLLCEMHRGIARQVRDQVALNSAREVFPRPEYPQD